MTLYSRCHFIGDVLEPQRGSSLLRVKGLVSGDPGLETRQPDSKVSALTSGQPILAQWLDELATLPPLSPTSELSLRQSIPYTHFPKSLSQPTALHLQRLKRLSTTYGIKTKSLIFKASYKMTNPILSVHQFLRHQLLLVWFSQTSCLHEPEK